MLKVSIKNKVSQQITNQAEFDNQAQIDAWVEECEKVEAFGKPEHQVEILDEDNKSFEPKQFETILAEYTIEIEDVTAQVNQAEINEAALRYLAETDYLVLRSVDDPSKPVSDEVKALRQAARDSIVK